MQELEDRKWFPHFLRTHQTEYLYFIADRFKLYAPIKPILSSLLLKSTNQEWTDVCSGVGGPIEALNLPNKVLLTDLYPQTTKNNTNEWIKYYPNPVDITKSLPPGKGLITIFNGFHHFNDGIKESIISRIKTSKRPFLFIEILQPNIKTILMVLFSTTIGHWCLVPFMKPLSFKRLFFTYIFPLHTLTVCIDGIISVINSKSATYYSALAARLSCNNYHVVFRKTKGPISVLYSIEGEPIPS